jgi:hypothetical protein
LFGQEGDPLTYALRGEAPEACIRFGLCRSFFMMNAATRSARLGITGVVVGVLALVAAVLPHWVLPAVFPAKPLDQVIVDTAQRIKDRLKRGDTPTMPVQRSQSQIWSQALSIAAVSLGLLAIALAVFSTMRGEERRYAVMAAALGIGAIAFQVMWIALGLIVVLVITYLVLG